MHVHHTPMVIPASIPSSQPSTSSKMSTLQPSTSYPQLGTMMGSTASLVGMLKAAALDSLHDLQAIHPDQEDVSSQSSDSQHTPEHPLPSAGSNLQPNPSHDFQVLHARRVAINRFASTLLHQHSALQQHALDASNRFSPSPTTTTHPRSSWTLANPNSAPNHPLSPSVSLFEIDEDSRTSVSEQDQLQHLLDHFGPWTGTDQNGLPETEAWISRAPGILTRNVLVHGTILLTNRRLCFVAYLPAVGMGEIIRSGPATLPSQSKVHKPGRSWMELRTDSLTQYKSSTKPFRPILSLHLSQIKHVLPLTSAHPKVLRLRLRNGKIAFAEFDTAEATSAWHTDFVKALFHFKTNRSNKIKIMIPLRRIRKLHRDTFESLAKVMNLDVDGAPLMNDIFDNDIVEEKFNQQKFDSTQIQLSYLLSFANFDDLILDAVVLAKLEITNAGDTSKHRTPAPLLKITTISTDEESTGRNENFVQQPNTVICKNVQPFINKFVEAFGLEESSNLSVFPCSLLRTFPSSGHVAISKDYFCFWHRGLPFISSDYKLKIPLKHIRDFRPTSAIGFHRYGLAIEVLSSHDIRLDFTSKSVRDSTIGALKAVLQLPSFDSERQGSQPPSTQALEQNAVPATLASPQAIMTPANIVRGAHISPIRPLRIVCLTIGSRGDVQPYISLAKRLMQDGHTVTIASHPEYRSWVESFGISYKDVGGDPAALMNFSVEHSFFSTGFFKEGLSFFKNWLENLFTEAWLATKDSQAELLIESPSTFSGIHIAEALCIPYFRAFTMTWTSTAMYPQAFASSIDLGPSYNLLSYSIFDILIWRAMSRLVNKWRQETLHIPPTSLEKMQAYKVPFMYNFSSAVVPKPLDWRDHIDLTGYWFLDQSQKNFVPPELLINFIASAKKDRVPLVYVGFGSVTVPDSTTVTKSIYNAVVQAGVRAIVAKGWSDRLEIKSKREEVVNPKEVYVVDSIPHDWLFPQMDAVCHHGGAGTTGISLRFGIPTIIHPFFGDQPFWADRVSRLGAGIKIDSLSVNALSEAFKRVTSDRIIKEKCQETKQRIQVEDGPGRAVQFIYQYLDFALERTQHRIDRTKPKTITRRRTINHTSTEPRTNQQILSRAKSNVLCLKSRRGRFSEGNAVATNQDNQTCHNTSSNFKGLNPSSGQVIMHSPSTLTTEPESLSPETSLAHLDDPSQKFISLQEFGKVSRHHEFGSIPCPSSSTATATNVKNKFKSASWALKRTSK